MKESLIGPIFGKIMQWTSEDVARERPELEALSLIKYDHYNNYSPGMRFFESLALWLGQFESLHERQLAYNFIKERIIYISSDELSHLISVTYPDHIKHVLIQKTARILQIPEWSVRRITDSVEFKIMKRRSLFLGLSDGADIGQFRRNNFEELDHEQILRSHEISNERCEDLIESLDEALSSIKGSESNRNTYCNVFLLDDFSGSGSSYLYKKEDGSFRGKIKVFYDDIKNFKDKKLFDMDDLHIYLVLYISTEESVKNLKRLSKELFVGDIKFDILVVNQLYNNIKIRTDESDLIDLLVKYFDNDIITKSYRTGKHDMPYLGYNECALPLILFHNTPNNTIPLIWFNENNKIRGLFPRISRHSE